MTELTAISPGAGQAPFTIGTVTCAEVGCAAITSVAPFRGQGAQVSAALQAQIGVPFPAPNRVMSGSGARAVWSGRDQALVLGPVLADIPGAALTDQSDGWACVALSGAGAADVLARLVPLDLRDGVFEVGHAARSLINHMTCVLMRTERDVYEIMVFRSMTGTLLHDLKSTMEAVAARG